MSGGNPRSAAWYRTQYSDKTVRRTVLAADTTTEHADVITPKSANHIIYVQRILFSVSTDAAQTITFRDDNNTPKVIGQSKSSPGLGLHVVGDYGAEGVPLTAGKNLDMILSAAGLAGIVTIEAYEKPVSGALYVGATSNTQ